MRAILVHGFNSTPDGQFIPSLAGALRDRGFDVVTPRLGLKLGEDGELKLPEIVESLRSQVGPVTGDDVFVGHSLGAFIILQYLEAVEMTETPRAVVMVAAPWKVSNQALRRLFIVDLDADVLMWKAREYVVVHSKDDTMVPIDHAKRLAESFRAKLVETDGCGHFMDAEYPILVEVIEDLKSRPFEFAPGHSLHDELANP
ncbi:alpha/beta fold hydrolase [Patescibacteria group bacterium]|nr:MAG: alpha/beta fold hydrolase [Patescibacteria group bacterium]